MKTYNVASPYFSNIEKKRIIAGTQKVLDGRLSTGPYTKEFEKKFAKFIGCKFAVFLNSCTSALEIAVKSLNLNTSTYLFTQLGGESTLANRGGGTSTVYHIDTLVRITGVNTGYTVDIPVRFVKYKS